MPEFKIFLSENPELEGVRVILQSKQRPSFAITWIRDVAHR